MISEELLKARDYESKESAKVNAEERPVFHLSPRIGWLNDPNGFSFYNGRYHMFYQYHPYDSHWGPMHWGHAVSDDMIRWEYLPCTMAPDTDYDGAGCFSGSAITLPDGKQMLMYTGCASYNLDEKGRWRQTQCLAVSDGDEFIKYENNPVIGDEEIPDGGDIYEFRDPYVWIGKDGIYRALVANAGSSESEASQLAVYRSDDAYHWGKAKVIFEDWRHIGLMWECPNLFELGGRHILVASPMDMEAEEAEGSIRFPKGNNVIYMVGDYDEETETFTPYTAAATEKPGGETPATYHPVDCGLDFYAPQIRVMPDGRRIMFGWMQDPSMGNLHDVKDFRIFGHLTAPRELTLRNNRIIQKPVSEIESYRGRMVYADIELEDEERSIDEISGRVMDIKLRVQPAEDAATYTSFAMRFAKSGDTYTELRYYPERSLLSIDRSKSGQPDYLTRRRTVRVRNRAGELDLRILLDKWSAEVFINGGEQVMSATFYTPLDADDVTFTAEGRADLEVTKYEIL